MTELFEDGLSRLPFSTAYIECEGTIADGTSTRCRGTSFFYITTGPEAGFYPGNTERPKFYSTVDPDINIARVVKGHNRLFLITNLHVFNGLGRFLETTRVFIWLKFFERDRNVTSSEWIEGIVADMTIIKHPTLGVDLIGFDISDAILQHKLNTGKSLLYFAFTTGSLLSPIEFDMLTVYEDVAMVGYPNGLYDEINNMPLVRGGKTATIPRKDYKGLPKFVIDCACMHGSSGSPVVLIRKAEREPTRGQAEYLKSVVITNNHDDSSSDEDGERAHSLDCSTSVISFVKSVDLNAKRNIYFLGVMSSGPMKDVNGQVVNSASVTTVDTHHTIVSLPMNLGEVIKATQVALLVREEL